MDRKPSIYTHTHFPNCSVCLIICFSSTMMDFCYNLTHTLSHSLLHTHTFSLSLSQFHKLSFTQSFFISMLRFNTQTVQRVKYGKYKSFLPLQVSLPSHTHTFSLSFLNRHMFPNIRSILHFPDEIL